MNIHERVAPLIFRARLVWLSFVVGSVVIFQGCTGTAATNSAKTGADEKALSVKTTFEESVRLSPKELTQVVELALQCGVPDVESIETFYYLPGTVKGIAARSSERINGRNVSYDTVYLTKPKWRGLERDEAAKRLGKFHVNYKSTTLLREYVFKEEVVRVRIGKGIDTEFADRAFALFGAGKVRFANRYAEDQFNKIKLEEVSAILKAWSGEGYELRFDKDYPMKGVRFKPGEDEILVSGISSIVI